MTQAWTPPRQPLYLEPEGPTLLTLEGPAICIQRKGRAETHIPLRRISRIIGGPRVQLDTEVILACARHGIVMLLHDDNDIAAARIIGMAGRNTRLRQRLVDLVARPDWYNLYTNWRDAQHRRIARTVAHQLGISEHHPKKVRHQLNRLGEYLDGKIYSDYSRRVIGELTLAWMTEHLATLGLGSEVEAWLNDRIDLPVELGGLLAFRLEPIRIGWLRRRHQWRKRHVERIRPPERKDLIRLFEKQSRRVERLGSDLTNRLHRWLVDLA